MPTDAEWEELSNTDNCSWTRTSIDGVNGYKIKSKKSGYTDNWIFLPTAGYRNGLGLYYAGSHGAYWSSSLRTECPNCAWCVLFYYEYVYSSDSGDRNTGRSVRPVSE